MGLHRIEVAIRPENVSSLRVVEKLGIQEIGFAPRFLHIDGDWRDHRIFAITREEVPLGLVHGSTAPIHTSHTSDLPTHRHACGSPCKPARIVIPVDLSAIIFVVLALAWAVYLIPKALKHHDEMASDRLVEGHSDKVRILARKRRTVVTDTVEAIEPPVEVSDPVEDDPVSTGAGRAPSRPTRAAARKAAQRRRRVLGLLLLAFAVVWTLTWFAYLPYMTPAIPGALVAAWLVLGRLAVRKQQRRRATTVVPSAVAPAPLPATEPAPSVDKSHSLVERLADEDLTGAPRQEIEAVLADDGSLWDPLPMTLPTYVNKARARRTVRTIELTGINSSGHDEADTALARDATESAERVRRPTPRPNSAG